MPKQMTCFAFLTRGPLPHAELWLRWLDAYGPHVVVVHAADPSACPWHCLPDPAPTTWEHLGAAHRRMVRAAAQTDAARMVVESGPDGSPRLGLGLFQQVPGQDIGMGCQSCKGGKR